MADKYSKLVFSGLSKASIEAFEKSQLDPSHKDEVSNIIDTSKVTVTQTVILPDAGQIEIHLGGPDADKEVDIVRTRFATIMGKDPLKQTLTKETSAVLTAADLKKGT